MRSAKNTFRSEVWTLDIYVPLGEYSITGQSEETPADCRPAGGQDGAAGLGDPIDTVSCPRRSAPTYSSPSSSSSSGRGGLSYMARIARTQLVESSAYDGSGGSRRKAVNSTTERLLP